LSASRWEYSRQYNTNDSHETRRFLVSEMSSTRAVRAATRKKEMQALLDRWGLGAQTTLFDDLGVVDVRDFAKYVLDEDIEGLQRWESK
jgi:hypothetical protein